MDPRPGTRTGSERPPGDRDQWERSPRGQERWRQAGVASRFGPKHDSVRRVSHQQTREPLADYHGRGGEGAEPATDRRDRSSAARGDLPVAPPQHCLRLDRRRDHLSRIGPPHGQPHLEEHMRAQAYRAPRPARPKRADRPIRAGALPNHTCPGPPPRAQPATTIRARYGPDPQGKLDNNRIMTYREHQRGLTR